MRHPKVASATSYWRQMGGAQPRGDGYGRWKTDTTLRAIADRVFALHELAIEVLTDRGELPPPGVHGVLLVHHPDIWELVCTGCGRYSEGWGPEPGTARGERPVLPPWGPGQQWWEGLDRDHPSGPVAVVFQDESGQYVVEPWPGAR